MVILVLLKPGLLSLTLPVLLFSTVIAFIHKNRFFSDLMRNRFWVLSLILPIIYVIGSFKTTNTDKAWFEIIQKLSIPLIGFLMIWPISDFPRFFRNMRKYYLMAVSISVLISLIISTTLFLKTHSYDAFLYKSFSGSNHPAYYAMFLSMAYIIAIENILKPDFFIYSPAIRILFLLIPVLGILLLASKSGLITIIVLTFYYGIRFTFGKLNHIKKKGLIKLAFWAFLFSFSFAILKSDRFYVASLGLRQIHDKPLEDIGTAGQRILIWESVLEITGKNLITGTGVGNDQIILNEKYREKHLTSFYEKSLNAHNQFLQALLVLGLFGLVFFVIYLGYPIVAAWKTNNPYLLGFGVIVIFNALTESILNRQAGVIFWTLWAFVLLAGPKDPTRKDNLTLKENSASE